jgi:outer membrane receptor protein involved in Fe transport
MNREVAVLLRTTACWAWVLACAGGAYAQSAPAGGDRQAEESPPEIIVTGSRIPRANVESASPITVFGGDQLLETSIADVSLQLRQLPSILDTLGPTNPAGFGVSTVALRGLRPRRTLTLVNGRRYISADSTGSVDVATIVPELVERVEIVTGGASAVYGSDAIAGVVNFVLRDDIQGLALNAGYGVTSRGEQTSFRISATGGSSFAGGRGSVAVSAAYEQTSPIYGRSRGFASPLRLNAGGQLEPFLDSTTIGGLLFLPDGTPAAFDVAGEVVGADGNPNPATADQQFDLGGATTLLQGSDRYSLFATADYDASDSVQLFFEGTFARAELFNQVAPPSIDLSGFQIPVASPFLGPRTQGLLGALGGGAPTVNLPGFSRRFGEFGSEFEFDRTSYRAVLGANIEIAQGWSLEAYGLYQRSEFQRRDSGVIVLDRLQQGLLAVPLVNGTVACADPSNGCVPVNIFGPDKLTEAARDFLGATTVLDGYNSDFVLSAAISGTAARLPGGDLGLSAGAEYRKSQAGELPDELNFNGLTSRGSFGRFKGENEFVEVFGEAVVPIISEQPFAHYLGLEGGLRHTRITGVSSNWTFKLLGEYAPIPELKFRGGFQRAVRAPSVFERFGSDLIRFVTPFDPCFIGEPLSGGLREVCISQGVPASVADAGSVAGANVEIDLAASGSPSLRPETADSITAGFVVSNLIGTGFSLSADYYNIRVKGAISQANFGIFEQCYFNDPDPTDPTCGLVVRNPATGFITRLNNDFLNFGELFVEGVDVSLSHTAAVRGIAGGRGRINLRFAGTYQLANESLPFAADPASRIDCLGVYGDGCSFTPRWSALSSIAYREGPVMLGFDWQWIGPARDIRSRDGEDVSALARTRVPSFHRVDAMVGFDVAEGFVLTVGVENLFDASPHVVGTDRVSLAESAFNSFTAYDQLGRRFFVTAGLRF